MVIDWCSKKITIWIVGAVWVNLAWTDLTCMTCTSCAGSVGMWNAPCKEEKVQ